MMFNYINKKDEKGFTLVELAIVLVIIGLILAGIIKGQELITNAKIKRTYNVQKEIAAAIYTYFDRYQFYPGDDPQALTRFPGQVPVPANGNGNGLIAAGAVTTAPNFACAAGIGEQCELWVELRQSGILTGSAYTNPTHPYGGAVAVSYFNMPVVGGGSTARLIHWIHFQNVPFDVCQLLDQQFDDGNISTGVGAGSGSIRSGAAAFNYMAAGAVGSGNIGFGL
jgi:prepilin-type N-terminal cleavage/methylation domain-containing protein